MSYHQVLISFCNLPLPKKYSAVLLNFNTEEGSYVNTPIFFGFEKMIKSSTGMTRGDGKIFILFSRWGDTYISIIRDKDFQPVRYQRLPEIKDPHSMLFYDSYIYVVSTGTDRVIRYKYQNNSLLVDPEVVWCASNRKADTHHINSIISFEGEILISAFGPKSSKKWTSAKNGYIYNISQGKVLVENIYHPHTISVRNGDIYYCESRTSEFHSINKGYIDKFNGYLRGVTWLSDEFVCIGSSNRGKNNIVRKLLTRITKKDFIHGSSKLYLYNVRSKQILDIVDLSSNGPEVYDLLYVSNIITHDTISGLSS